MFEFKLVKLMQRTTDNFIWIVGQNQHRHVQRPIYAIENINIKKGLG